MASTAQILANRANAQRSTGPKTESGKTASCRNAVKHGLSSPNFAILPNEDPHEFDQLVAGLRQQHTPENDAENFLVDQIAKARWKMMRIERLEAEAFDMTLEQAGDAQDADRVLVRALSAGNSAFDRLHRYAAAAERAYYKALRELEASRVRSGKMETNALETCLTRVMMAPVPGVAERKIYHAAVNQYAATQTAAMQNEPVSTPPRRTLAAAALA